ncbi:MAG: hypothetical protein NTY73_04640 [Candidatus Micrarchaeota archaeon]|nr:hypothetical protein [Candidatus Micrarchaeota archaeon]
MGICRDYFYIVQNVLSEKPSYRVKRLLHEIYSFDEKEITMGQLAGRAGLADSFYYYPLFSIMEELGLIKRHCLWRGYKEWVVPEPMKIIWKDKENMKKMWPPIEEWGKSMIPPVGIKTKTIKKRNRWGELLEKGLVILDKNSLDELTKADEENINNLNRADYLRRGWQAGYSSVQRVKKTFLQRVALNESMEEKTTKYTFSDDAMKQHFHYLVARLHPDEQEVFREIGRNIEEKGEITRNEIKKIFEKYVASPYEALYVVDQKLNKILRSFVRDGGLEKSVGRVEREARTILKGTKQKILQYADEHPDRVVKVPDERFGEIKVVRLPRNFPECLGGTKEKLLSIPYNLKTLEKEGKHLFFHEGAVGSYIQDRKLMTESQAKVLNACFDPATGEYIRLGAREIAAKTGLKRCTIRSTIISLEIRGYMFKEKKELEPVE